MKTSDQENRILNYIAHLNNDSQNNKTKKSKTYIKAYKTTTDEELISIRNITDETELAKNKIAYNLRVLLIKPNMVWNRTHLYRKKDVVTLLTYITHEFQLDKLKSKTLESVARNN